jgi:hypothetical protein
MERSRLSLVEPQKAPGIKVTTLSPSRTLQYPLHAAQADAVPLDQLQVRHTQTAIFEQMVDDLTDRSHGARRERSGRVPCGDSVDARLRVLWQADDHRLGP